MCFLHYRFLLLSYEDISMLGAKWPVGDKAFFGAGKRVGRVPKTFQERTMLWHCPRQPLSHPDPSEEIGRGAGMALLP